MTREGKSLVILFAAIILIESSFFQRRLSAGIFINDVIRASVRNPSRLPGLNYLQRITGVVELLRLIDIFPPRQEAPNLVTRTGLHMRGI